MSAGIGAALGDPNIEIYATLGEPHEIAATLSDLRYLVFQGMKGDTGDSAYEEAVALGFVGTEAEWIASLKGEKGDSGAVFLELKTVSNRQVITYNGEQITGAEIDAMYLNGALPVVEYSGRIFVPNKNCYNSGSPSARNTSFMFSRPVSAIETTFISVRYDSSVVNIINEMVYPYFDSGDDEGKVLTVGDDDTVHWETPQGGGAVDSVNGKTGVVVLDASDVGALPSSYTPPVSSVNGKTGTVTLGAADVHALPDSTVIPPTVTEQTVAGWGFTKNTGTYSKPSGGIPASDLASAVQTSLGKADTALQTAPVTSVNTKTGAVTLTASDVGAYVKPSGGIPASDLASGVIPSVPQMATQADMSDWTQGKTVDADVLKNGVQYIERMIIEKPDASDIPDASTSTPAMDGTAAAGSSAAYARADHVHPSDTTRLATTGNAYRSASIPMGHLDATSTATVMTATVDGITELRDGVCMWLQNGVITSASGFTLNVNGLGAKPCYSSLAAESRSTTIFNVNYALLMIYNSTRVDGGCWDIVYGIDTNTTYTTPKLGFGYAVCSTAAATVAKTASISSYALTAGGIVSIHFNNDVPSGATLNISSKGAKAIYHRGAAITDGVIKGGDTATFVYSTYYHLIAIDRDDVGDALPSVTASDNGKVLGVVNGAWSVKADEVGSTITVDDALSTSSTNPVQNKVVKAALDAKADASALAAKQDTLTAGQNVTINGNTISADVDSAEIAANVTDWLDTNVSPVGSAVVVDSSLSVSGAAADAKVVGDKIKDVQNLRPDVVYQNTITGTGTKSVTALIPAGTYDLAIASIVSSDTDDTKSSIAFRNGNTAVKTISFGRNTEIKQSVTFNQSIDNIIVYASTSYNKSQGDSFEVNGLSITKETELNSTISALKMDSDKVAKSDASIANLLGAVNLDGLTATPAQNAFPVASVNVKNAMIYRFSAKVASAVQGSTTVYLNAPDGTRITYWTIASGATEVNGKYTAQNDYNGAYLTVSVSSSVASVEFETLRLEFDGLVETCVLPNNVSSISIENENSYKQSDILYSADCINITTDGSEFSGVEFEFYKPAVGTVIVPTFDRNVGNNSKYKMQITDVNGASYTTYDNPIVVRNDTLRVVVTLIACWGTALPAGTVVTFSNVRIKCKVVDGEGNQLYRGERIVLSDDSNLNRCSIDLWADYKVADIPNLANYNLHLNQSMTIFDGYMFLFNDGGTGCAIDFDNKSILSTFSFEPSSSNHANSAQFTDVYFDTADEYPLMILSRCYGTGKDECFFYRVKKNSENVFTFTLINTVSLDLETTYGMSWGIDNTSHKLYCTLHLNGNYQVTENNPFNYYVFQMPTRAQIISGTPIVLSLSDAEIHMTIGHVIHQGMAVDGGVVYQGMQAGNPKRTYVYAVCPEKNRITSKIPLVSQYEPEGVAIYQGKLYVSQKLGSDTAATNPLKIYELSF